MTPWWIPSRSDVFTALTVAVLLTVLGSGSAVAREPQSPSPSADDTRARAIFAEAQHAYDLGQFNPALDRYSEAYRLKPLPGFLFNIAQCHRQLGNYEQAAFFYQRYLDLLPEAPNAEAAHALLAECRQKVDEEARRKAEVEKRKREIARSAAFAPGGTTAPRIPVAEESGIVHRWWFWTGVGVVAAGAVGVGLAVGLQPQPRTPSLGTVNDR